MYTAWEEGAVTLYLGSKPVPVIQFADAHVREAMVNIASCVVPLTQAQSCKAWFALRRFVYSSTAVARTYRTVLSCIEEFADLCDEVKVQRPQDMQTDQEKEDVDQVWNA
jgi:hypothetical protein